MINTDCVFFQDVIRSINHLQVLQQPVIKTSKMIPTHTTNLLRKSTRFRTPYRIMEQESYQNMPNYKSFRDTN